jgi:hypothetical protein
LPTDRELSGVCAAIASSTNPRNSPYVQRHDTQPPKLSGNGCGQPRYSRNGAHGYRTRELARTLWIRNSPHWRFDEATLTRHASAFDNPDYVDVVIHSYRHLDEARRMSRGPRACARDPEPYHALKEKIESLDNTAARLPIPEGTSTTTMKNRILRVAVEVSIPMTVRKGTGGLLFWRSTYEDLQQATEVMQRLQLARKPPRTTRRGTRRRG